MKAVFTLCILLGASYSHAAAVGTEPPEVWLMGVQVCLGPPGYGDAVRRGIIPGQLRCVWQVYTGQTPNVPYEFGSEKDCDEQVITEINENYHWGDRNCQRVE